MYTSGWPLSQLDVHVPFMIQTHKDTMNVFKLKQAVIKKKKESVLLKAARPDLYREIDFEASAGVGMTKEQIDKLSVRSNKKIYWMCNAAACSCTHRWQTIVSNRTSTKGTGCPGCSKSGRLACEHNNVAVLFPLLALEFHPTKNGEIDLKKLRRNSNKSVNWTHLCPHGCGAVHDWMTTVEKRTRGTNCPFCSSAGSVCRCQSLGVMRPELCAEINTELSKEHDIYKLAVSASSILFSLSKS